MTECCNEFGGVITIEAGDLRLSARGDVTLEPFNFERTVEAGHDGRTYGVRRPKPYRASFSYSRPCHLDDLQSIMGCAINVTITEDNGGQHLFTAAMVAGTISYNASTGEISGMTIEGDKYRHVAAPA